MSPQVSCPRWRRHSSDCRRELLVIVRAIQARIARFEQIKDKGRS